MVGTYIAHTCPLEAPNTLDGAIYTPFTHLVLKAAKSECLRESSDIDLRRSECILPAAEKTRSTPAEEAGAAKYCLAILDSAGHVASLTFHHLSRSKSFWKKL